jgi:hypothetical protein
MDLQIKNDSIENMNDRQFEDFFLFILDLLPSERRIGKSTMLKEILNRV